ncbi:MAG: RNA methyltransferase [Eubacteriales bacterium]|nr:RNA methyltransferase [Eubacteriales bacterium]
MNGVITSTKNEFVKYAKSLGTKKGRRQTGAFLVEGEKCVRELIAHKPECLQCVAVLENSFTDLINLAQKLDKPVYIVSDNVMRAICDSKTPQGIAAIALIPEFEEACDGFVLALDDVQDPQNVGTMIRTADAAGCACVVLSRDSADCFSPKAVRASMGSLFHLPVIRAELGEHIGKLAARGYHIVTAHLAGTEKYDFDWQKTCLVIGNESRGVSEQIQKRSTHLIRIPMYGKAESLNAAVAAGILIYKIRT